MVEELAKVIKNLEQQFAYKKQENDNIFMSLNSLSRKIDQSTTQQTQEIISIKKRQYQLFQLY